MKIVAKVITYPYLAVIYLGAFLLPWLYLIDYFHDLFTNPKIWMWILTPFIWPFMFLFLYWAVALASIAPKLATADDATPIQRVVGIVLTPLGLFGGVFFWALQDWFIFGVLGVEPWAYNGVFGPAG